ncbi:hypothetical protein [Uliginosibacterium sediminicola]|uniref:Uncharacterized protein n=1 Tax=Uliginosibacterium sediminicola TaxID=2024550 RepID=A0ABU9YUV8_9RHOO
MFAIAAVLVTSILLAITGLIVKFGMPMLFKLSSSQVLFLASASLFVSSLRLLFVGNRRRRRNKSGEL